MKTYACVVIAGTFLFSCNTQELEEKIVQLESEKTELLTETQRKDASMVDFMSSLSEIESNLDEIRTREMNIEIIKKEGNLSADELGEKIKEDIQAINTLLQENRQKVVGLNQQLAMSKSENAKLNRLMGQLKAEMSAQIEEREEQIMGLKNSLADMEVQVEELNLTVAGLEDMGAAKDSIIQQRVGDLNTAYFVVGNKKDLEAEQVIDREGGLLGIGKTEKLSSNLNTQKFEKIDIREKRSFVVPSNKVELVSAHPSSAYRIEQADDQATLVISDPEKFWESSKYLVMLTK